MRAAQALVQLQRMLAMKEERLANYRGSAGSEHFLRADIAALAFAVTVIDALGVEEAGALSRSSVGGRPALLPHASELA